MKQKLYLVGGAVRDHYMGRESKDFDYVVTGSTPEEMDAMDQLRRVGKDFPIWVDGKGNEYALARSSRTGDVTTFSPDTTIEQDLLKRDLTINAMAWDREVKEWNPRPFGSSHMQEDVSEPMPKLVDPCNGLIDLRDGILRMTSFESFVEDPIRVLRVARFAARFPDFKIDPSTYGTMCHVVASGGLHNAQPERVWKELSRGLMEETPSRMIGVLQACGALKVILPEVSALYNVPQPELHHPEICTGTHIEQALDVAAKEDAPLEVRYAVLLHDVGKALTPKDILPSHPGHEAAGVPLIEAINARLRVPVMMGRIAVTVGREHLNIHRILDVKTTTLVKFMRRCDAFRNPDRFSMIIHACRCDARGRVGVTGDYSNIPYPQWDRLANAVVAARQVRGHGLAEQYKDRPEFIPAAIHALRARAIRAAERTFKSTKG